MILLLDVIAATLLVGTGCSAIMRWRLSRERVSLSVGIATIALAAMWLVPTRVVGPGFDVDAAWVTVVAGAGLVILVLALADGTGGVPLFLTKQPGRATRWWWVVGASGLAAGALLLAGSRPSIASSFTLEARLALFVFASMASLYLLVGHRQRRWLHGWVGLGLMALCYAELQVAFSGGRMTFHLVAALLRLVAAGIVLNGVARELIDAYVAQQQRLFGAVLNVQAVEIGKAAARSREAEIRHDLRSGLMSIQAAMGALSRTRADTEFLSGATLTDAVSAEIKRLWALTDQVSESEPVVFDLAEALVPTITCHRSLMRLETSVPEERRAARPARRCRRGDRQSPRQRPNPCTGCLVVLTAARVGPFVEIEVSDDGPGVADEVRPRLFDRGFTTRRDGTGSASTSRSSSPGARAAICSATAPRSGLASAWCSPRPEALSEEPTIDLTEPSVMPS